LFLNRYLAAEESEIMKSDHKQLENIKNELNKYEKLFIFYFKLNL
jgi:hypothetical protein